jgi:hypothetical protein
MSSVYFLFKGIFTPGIAALLTAIASLLICGALALIIYCLKPKSQHKKPAHNYQPMNFTEIIKRYPEESAITALVAGFLFTKYDKFRDSTLDAASLYIKKQYQTADSQDALIDILSKTISNLFSKENNNK